MGEEWMEMPREGNYGVTARGMLKAGFRARSRLAGSHDLYQQEMCITQHSFFFFISITKIPTVFLLCLTSLQGF